MGDTVANDFFFPTRFPRRAVSGPQQKFGGRMLTTYILASLQLCMQVHWGTHRPSPSIRKEVVREGTGPVVGKLKILLTRGFPVQSCLGPGIFKGHTSGEGCLGSVVNRANQCAQCGWVEACLSIHNRMRNKMGSKRGAQQSGKVTNCCFPLSTPSLSGSERCPMSPWI